MTPQSTPGITLRTGVLPVAGLLMFLATVAVGTPDQRDFDEASTEFGDSIINLIQWPLSAGGNDHWYGIHHMWLEWQYADTAVRKFTVDGLPGYLATITSYEENTFVIDSVVRGLVNTSPYDEYNLGGCYDNGSWYWITGEAFYFVNWAPNQPAAYVERGPIMMWGASSTTYGMPGQWELWYFCHGSFYSIVEWGGLNDTDNDSVPDIWDNCPTVSNSDQTDDNSDGVGNACDSTALSVNEDEPELPAGFRAICCYPNPFNESTDISFEIARRSSVDLTVYNVLGQRVRLLVSEDLSAGPHSVSWDGRDDGGRQVASGVYLYRLSVGDHCITRKMLLLK
ncbi:MAG: FlgD immunoglobulin-like domain containing protein [bacterium]